MRPESKPGYINLHVIDLGRWTGGDDEEACRGLLAAVDGLLNKANDGAT